MRVRNTRRRLISSVAAVAAVCFLLQTGLQGGAATAAEYPSWSDVEAARSDEASKRAQIDQLSALIAQLKEEAAAARAESDRRSQEYEVAQAAFDEAAAAAADLDQQTESARSRAEESSRAAGRVAVMMSRSSTLGVGTEALMDANRADALLGRLGAASRLTLSLNLIQETAQRDQREVASLLAQAEVARAERERLLAVADAAFQAAAEASALTEARLAEEQQFGEQLKAQLAVLSEDRAATEADFARGQEARRQAEQSSPDLDAGQLSDQGWARPVPGWITDPYGPRPEQPVAGVNPFHYATDLSAGCGTPIYAATDGTVDYAGWFGTYGNWLLLDHGSGVQTGYAHTSKLLVSQGQQVSAGQVVALAGTTGASTGCHLHYEVRVDGARIDPEPFMSSRGAALG